MSSAEPGLVQKKLRLLMELRRAGIGDARVLGAIEKTPREKFVPPAFEDQAYENLALPIVQGQTVSQPYVVALMTEKLELGVRHNALEIGTGSGYQTAVLARLCRRVFSVERQRELLRDADMDSFRAKLLAEHKRRMDAVSDRRELYRSSNGDTWFLGREPANDHAFVIHQPNAPSGGRSSHIEVGAFLGEAAAPVSHVP